MFKPYCRSIISPVMLYIAVCLYSTPALSQWTAMNTGLDGTDGRINTLVCHGNILYIGGGFSVAGKVFTKNIAQWDGKEWAPVGNGLDMPVDALCCDSQGQLYAAVVSPTIERLLPAGRRVSNLNQGANGSIIWKWDGKDWRIIGKVNLGTVNGYGVPLPGYVKSLACDSKNRLIVSGEFYNVEGCKAIGIAMWDGKIWHPLDDGRHVFPKYLNPTYGLVAGKNDAIYAINEKYVGSWDGSSWSLVGDTLTSAPVAIALDRNGFLVAAGRFSSQNENNLPLAIYVNGTWQYPHLKVNSSVTALNSDAKGTLYLGTISTIFVVQNNELKILGSPEHGKQLQGGAKALTFDIHGNLYAAGYDLSIGGKYPPVSILQWNGTQWNKLTDQAKSKIAPISPPARHFLPKNLPLPDSLSIRKIKSFTITPDSHVYISGDFIIIDGKECLNHLAHWDGKAWHAVGAGLPSPAALLASDAFGNVYAAGRFPSGESNCFNSMLRWDGIAFHPVPLMLDDITALTCDISGYLYIGTAAPNKGNWSKSLCRWDDSILTVISGAPAGSYPCFNQKGEVKQLEIIGSKLHVSGTFITAGNMICSGYAIYDLGAPDIDRIKAKRAAMLHATSRQITKPMATMVLKEAYCDLGTSSVTRFEKMEVINNTSEVLDSAVLFTNDSSLFLYDKVAHITSHPVITSVSQGFRFSFPLRTPLLPGKMQQLWIYKEIRNTVSLLDSNIWEYKDTLRTIFANVKIKPGWDGLALYRLSIVEYDSFTVISGGDSKENMQYTNIQGASGTPFKISFARKVEYDTLCAGVLAYVNNNRFINEYYPPPANLLPGLKSLSRVKQELLGRKLLEWCFSFNRPLLSNDLWNIIGEDPQGSVPEPEELKKRFMEVSVFYLDVLRSIAPSLKKETFQMIEDWVSNWKMPYCGNEEIPDTVDRFDVDIVYCYENTEGYEPQMGFYPMELILRTLKILGDEAKESLKSFQSLYNSGE